MRDEVRIAAARFGLAVPRRALTGTHGERLGRGLGSSVEFEDHRDYQPGDDPRHVDWRAYARTDRLAVRLYREEVAPVVDLIVDRSASMAVRDAKARALRDLIDALGLCAGQGGGRVRFLEAGGGTFDPARETALDRPPTALLPRSPLFPRSLRVVVSDFLTPDDPAPALQRIAAGAAHLFVVQLLDGWELDPLATGPATLVDVESPQTADLVLDRATIAAYRQRLRRLQDDLADATRRIGGTFAVVRAAEPDAMLGGDLLRQEVLVPA